MVDDTARKHKEGLQHLRQAQEFAEWSHKDRQERLPKLTDEQKTQMMQYITLVQQHGMSKSFDANAQSGVSKEEACVGCPVMGSIANATKQALGQSPTAD